MHINIINKSKQAKWNKKNRVLEKGYIDINTSHVVQLQNVVEHYIREMNVYCEHCGAKHFKPETIANKKNSINDCCSHGSVKLDLLPQPPYELYELFTGNHPKSNHFYNRIRGYNNTFSFASFNANISDFSAQSLVDLIVLKFKVKSIIKLILHFVRCRISFT